MTTYSAVRDDALARHDLVGLTEALSRREVSPAELLAAALERAHASQSALNAVVSWVPEPKFRYSADAPMAGVPTFLKDNENLAGMVTRDGSRALPERVAESNSPVGSLLQDLGMTFLGKSSMPEFGLTATTEPLLNGPTHNPWALGHSAGGSSGGAAALVAAGVVPIAHANDGGGSTRIPAACCGLVGLKPSRGRLPNAVETDQLPIRIVSQGVLTRSVRDTAFLFAEAERRHRPSGGLTPIGHVTSPSSRRLRIRVVTEGLTGPVAPEVANVVLGAAELCADLGHDVAESDMGVYAGFGRDFLRYWAGLAFALRLGGRRLYGPNFDRGALEPFTHGLADFFGTVSPGIPAALARLRRLPARHAAAFESFDVLLSPTIGYPPPPLGFLAPDQDFRTHVARLLPFAGFTAVQNVAGTPAISLPLGADGHGRPVGVQFAAAFNDERTLLELAYELESAAPWPHTPDVGQGYSGVGFEAGSPA